MTTVTSRSTVPVGAVLIAGVGAQIADAAAHVVFPPLGLMGPLFVLLLTAGAARYVTRDLTGPAIARTGLAVGAVSGVVGLVFGGTGLLAVAIAVLTLVVGVAGAAVGRRSTV